MPNRIEMFRRLERQYFRDRLGTLGLQQLDGMILRTAEGKLHANLERDVKNSTAYTMAVLFNCIAESESDLLVDPYLNSLRAPPEGR